MFVSAYLTCNTGIARENLQKLSEIGSHVTNAGIPFVIAGDWNVPTFRIAGIKLACPNQRRDLAPRVTWKSRAFLED